MGKFDGVLLVSDFDDTLYNTKQEVSAENLSAIGYFTREGGTFTLATGRAHRTMAPHIHKCAVNGPVILSNGASIFDFEKGVYLEERLLVESAKADLYALCQALPTLGVECYHGDDVYIHNPNEFTHRHVIRVNTPWQERNLMDIPAPWSKAVIQDEYPKLLEAQAWIRAHYGDRYEVIFSNSALLECTGKNATKGSMVLNLAGRLGIKRENIYCVGDNQNDLPMLAVSQIPFAPENCAQAVKDSHPILIPSCDDHAIAHIIGVLDGRY